MLLAFTSPFVRGDLFGDFTSTVNENYITINDYPTTAVGAVTISSKIAGKPVTRIGIRAFADCTSHGVNLLLAYALNLDPHLNLSGTLPKPVLSGGQLSITFFAGSEGVNYAVETSSERCQSLPPPR